MFYNTKNKTNNQTPIYNPTTANPFRLFALALVTTAIALSSISGVTASAMTTESCRPKCNIAITVCKNVWSWISWQNEESCYDYSDLKLCTSSDNSGCTKLKTKRDVFFMKYITTSPAGDHYLNANSKYWSECKTICKPF